MAAQLNIHTNNAEDSASVDFNAMDSDLGVPLRNGSSYSPFDQNELDDDSGSLNEKIDLKLSLEDNDSSLSRRSDSTSSQNAGTFNYKLDQKDFDESEIEREEQEQKQAELEMKARTKSTLRSSTNSLATTSKDPVEDNQIDADSDENEPLELNDEWRSKFKHVFILSEAGKPIYSLHGNEVELITFMGLMQALVSIVECDNENKLKHVVAGEHKFVFLHKSHLILVCVSKEPQKCVEQIELELNYVYNQVLSVVTLSLIEKIFSKHHNYDLRNKLSGTEKLLTNIINRVSDDYGMFLNCVNSYPLASESRDQVARFIAQQINSIKYVLFGLLLFDNRLITLIKPKAKNIHPVDIHLLVNVITGLNTPKEVEFTWYPICLPNFDSSGIMYAYISHLDSQCNTCLILLTGLCDQEQSTELNECRKRIQQKLNSLNFLQTINLNINNLDSSLRLDQIGVPELKNFLFKDKKVFQYFVSDFALPFSMSPEHKKRIFNIYQRLYHKLHNPNNSLRIVYCQQKYETILGWMTSDFEIYATFSPLASKDLTIQAINKLLDFIRKNKPKIFLSSTPTLQR